MIYVDSSVVLAEILSESTRPVRALWDGELCASRLVEHETWVRLNAYEVDEAHQRYARAVLGRLAFAELTPAVLERATAPFPKPVRTLDALHLATCVFLRSRRRPLQLATYDARLAAAARELDLEVIRPE